MCAADVNTMLPLKTHGPKKIHLGLTTGRIVTNWLSLVGSMKAYSCQWECARSFFFKISTNVM